MQNRILDIPQNTSGFEVILLSQLEKSRYSLTAVGKNYTP